MIRRSARSRSGFTLVESLTTMVLLTAFLAISCSLVKLMLSLETGDRDHLALIETTARLNRSFRDDVHAARRVFVFPPGPNVPSVLVLEMPDGRSVRYEAGPEELRRIETFATLSLRANGFNIGGRPVRFSVDESSDSTLVGLAYDRRKAAQREDPRPIRMEAALGLDQRFRQPVPEVGP